MKIHSKIKKAVGVDTLYGHIKKRIAPKPRKEYSTPRKVKNAVVS